VLRTVYLAPLVAGFRSTVTSSILVAPTVVSCGARLGARVVLHGRLLRSRPAPMSSLWAPNGSGRALAPAWGVRGAIAGMVRETVPGSGGYLHPSTERRKRLKTLAAAIETRDHRGARSGYWWRTR